MAEYKSDMINIQLTHKFSTDIITGVMSVKEETHWLLFHKDLIKKQIFQRLIQQFGNKVLRLT